MAYKKKTYSMSAAVMMEIYKELDNSCLRQHIKKECPDLFTPERFDFGTNFNITTAFYDNPLVIGQGLVPREFCNKALVIDRDWVMKQGTHNGHDFIYFEKKSK